METVLIGIATGKLRMVMDLDDLSLLVLLLSSIIAPTAFVTIIAYLRFKGSITIAVSFMLGIFAGVGGASHGPSELLQGHV